MQMIHSTRNVARYGGVGCKCARSRTIRTRENRAWRRENEV